MARARFLFRLAAVVILLAGYTGAAMIFHSQDRLEQDNSTVNDNAPLPLPDSRAATRQAELYYGKSGLVTEGVMAWVEKWTHGRPLAKLIIVLSSGAAIGCFIMSCRRMGNA